LALVTLAACSRPVSAPAPSLRIAVALEPESLNPLFNESLIDVQDIIHLYNDPLWAYDANGRLVARLAADLPTRENGEISADGRTIVVRLRRDVKWQDGVPFTSADVRFSWQAMMDPRNNVGSRDGVDQVTGIDLPNAATAVVHLRRRYAPAVPAMLPELIPAHLFHGGPINVSSMDAAPVGTGPYRVVRWKRGDSIDLVANETYYRGVPAIRKIRVLFVPSVGTRAIMLQTGEADLAEIDRDAYRQIDGSPNVRIVVFPKRAFSAFFLNVTRPLLTDVRIRRALAYALDRAMLVRTGGYGAYRETLANGYASPISFAYDPRLGGIPFDRRRAAQLLEAAGWHLGHDGLRTRDGVRLTLVLAELAGATRATTIDTLAQAMWRSVGVDVTTKTYSGETIFAPTASRGVLATGNFDLYFDTYTTFFDPDSSWLLTCSRAEPRGFNESRFCNHDVDDLESAALGAGNQRERRLAYARVDRLVQDSVPLIFVSWPQAVFGVSSHLRGFSYNGISKTWDVFRWTLQR